MMKFNSINELDTFSFHDAKIKTISICGDKIIFFLSSLNANTQNSQNTDIVDLCIEDAEMDFLDAKIKRIEFLGYEVYDAHGNLTKKVEPKLAEESDFSDIVSKTTEDGWSYFQSLESIQKLDDNFNVCFCIDGSIGMYNITIESSCVYVMWDRYSGIAWYEKPPFRKA